MPKSCLKCQYHNVYYHSTYGTCIEDACDLIQREINELEGHLDRPPWCPLILESDAIDWLMSRHPNMIGYRKSGDVLETNLTEEELAMIPETQEEAQEILKAAGIDTAELKKTVRKWLEKDEE